MGAAEPTIALAVITYARPDSLRELLTSLGDQQGLAQPPVLVVVDNDPQATAREVVEAFAGAHADWVVQYQIEPDPGIPLARERSVHLCLAADADAVVFVDDDEIAPASWLATLTGFWRRSGADVVTGPVQGLLPDAAPAWNRRADVHTSVGKHRTGDRLPIAYTNNTLVSRAVLESVRPAFDPHFRFSGSSDAHFFMRVARAGFDIRWCDEAVITERVPIERTSWRWLSRRAFRSGAGDTISRRRINPGPASVGTSVGLAGARFGSGVLLLGRAAVDGVRPPERRSGALAKGVRRVCSAAGTLAGLVGITHQEYRR